MEKFKKFIFFMLFITIVKGCNAYTSQSTLIDKGIRTQISIAEILNVTIPMLLVVLILAIIYLVILVLKRIKNNPRKYNKNILSNNNSTLPINSNFEISNYEEEKDKSDTNSLIGWCLFSAIVIGGFAGGGGYLFAYFTLELAEQSAEMFGWACAIVIGALSFSNRWELF
ncbi:hypothetical protein [Photobacterium leiognathi]|uniref:hypothetical protein n=1 Tax=Photobacterium leiognathi TaxID=553611 RepID=UPI002981D1B4|nr:hypothetical protein [Photobacterium leiognathi]